MAMSQSEPKLMRLGIVGLDTSHVPAFTKLFNNPKADGDLAGFKVVAGYPGGTDMPASRDRVAKFTEEIRGMGVEIVHTIPELLERVDMVLLESVDGRIHLKEAGRRYVGRSDRNLRTRQAAQREVLLKLVSSLWRQHSRTGRKPGSRRNARSHDLGTMLLSSRYSRLVFLRHTWRRAVIHVDGNRLRDRRANQRAKT